MSRGLQGTSHKFVPSSLDCWSTINQRDQQEKKQDGIHSQRPMAFSVPNRKQKVGSGKEEEEEEEEEKMSIC